MKVDGLGGTEVVVPSAREAVGGSVGRRVRRKELGSVGDGKT